MKVFVTGGSGFVGGHVIEALAPDHEVYAMARSERSAEKVRAFGATPVMCSLDDVNAEHLKGIDAVVHAAAYVEEWGTEADYFDANVGGTQAVLDAARAAGTHRFVLVSTNATVHNRSGQLGIDETTAYPDHAGFAYGGSKAEAERRVLDANEPGFTTVAIRPCFVWGPRDNSVLPSLVRMHEEGSFVWVDGGRARISTTHVRTLVDGIVKALTGGNGGQAYFVADAEPTTVRDFLTEIAAAEGIELKGPSVPGAVVRGLAAVLEGTWRLVGAKSAPPVTRMAAMLMSRDMTVSTAKAQCELGWSPLPATARSAAA